jgi:hypothetical protein
MKRAWVCDRQSVLINKRNARVLNLKKIGCLKLKAQALVSRDESRECCLEANINNQS